MIRDILQFFRQEKPYAILFLILLAVYGLYLFTPKPQLDPGMSSPELEELRQAEQRVYHDLASAGSFEEFLRNNPVFARLYGVLFLFILAAFGFGIMVNLALVWNKRWRQGLTVHTLSPPQTVWKPSMLFKVVVLFMVSGFLLNLFSSTLHSYVGNCVSENFLVLLQTTLIDFLCLYFMVYVVREAGGVAGDLGFRVPGGGIFREMGVGVLGYFGIFPIFVMVLLLLVLAAHVTGYEPPVHPLVNIFLEEEERNPGLIFYSVFLATFVGPLIEEIFFRGFCYPALSARWGKKAGMVLSSVFFAVIHENMFSFLPIFILGLALVYVYEKRRCLVASMTLHLVHNAIFIAYFFLTKQMIVEM